MCYSSRHNNDNVVQTEHFFIVIVIYIFYDSLKVARQTNLAIKYSTNDCSHGWHAS